jgi:Na+/proline symporter
MFKHLTDLSFRRTALQAFGFYLVFLLIGFLVCGLAGGLADLIAQTFRSVPLTHEDNMSAGIQLGARYGSITAVIYVLAMNIAVCLKKRRSILSYVLVILAGLLSLFLGCLAGLIPAAYLTTRPALNSKAVDKEN